MAETIYPNDYVTFVRTGGIPVTVVRYGGTYVRLIGYGGKAVTFVKYGGQPIVVDREALLPEDIKEEVGY